MKFMNANELLLLKYNSRKLQYDKMFQEMICTQMSL